MIGNSPNRFVVIIRVKRTLEIGFSSQSLVQQKKIDSLSAGIAERVREGKDAALQLAEIGNVTVCSRNQIRLIENRAVGLHHSQQFDGCLAAISCIGSSAVSGALDIESAAQLTDSGGISFRKAAQAYQLDVYDFPKAKEEFQAKQIAKYLELHIEQAPILESRHKAAACVYGITGCKRQYITFTGQQAHSGCPIPMRRDAFLAAAQAALAFRYIGNAYTQGDTYAYCTVGSVQVSPGVVTIFPGTCRISLDQRHIDRGILEEIYNEAQEACIEAAQENHVDVSFETIWDIPPTIFDASLVALCKEAVKEETGEATAIYSGPLHDAAEIAKILPSVMMFVRSIEGLSHCKEENTSDIDLEIGIAAFLRLADKVIQGETVC